MKSPYINDKGFSLTELMFAMTILAVGLLAMAQLQIVAMRGTASSRDFSIATNLAKEGVEQTKVPGQYHIIKQAAGAAISNAIMSDENTTNDDDDKHAPTITTDTDIIADLDFDTVEVLKQNTTTHMFDVVCWRQYNNNCDSAISNTDNWDFVRIYNVRNIPEGSDLSQSIMKDINVIVLWKDGALTRSVNVRTIVARKDYDFF
jgi:type IV pilus modification protein PilV